MSNHSDTGKALENSRNPIHNSFSTSMQRQRPDKSEKVGKY